MAWLDDVKGRCEAATAGPWDVQYFYGLSVVYDADGDEVAQLNGDYPPSTTMADTAQFVCAARTDLPRCIAWIERAKVSLEIARSHHRHANELVAASEIDTLLSELEQA